jgi:low affinity Fe/Cu permease
VSNAQKRILATVLILIGTFLLIIMIDDFYIKTAITALFVTIATFIMRRRAKLEEKRRLHERLEKELDEEERLKNMKQGIDTDKEDTNDENDVSTEEPNKDGKEGS